MEIENVKKLAAETELAILALIRDFTNKTGLSVSDIDFVYANPLGSKYMHSPVSVNLTIHI
jgi:hypothetical protein